MSYTSMYALSSRGAILETVEFRNSHLSANLIWNAVCRTHGRPEHKWLTDPDWLWPLWKHPATPEDLAIVLFSTYDGIWCSTENASRLADSIDRVLPSVSVNGGHWPEISRRLRAPADWPAKTHGFGWCWTSVGDDAWQVWDSERDRMKLTRPAPKKELFAAMAAGSERFHRQGQ